MYEVSVMGTSFRNHVVCTLSANLPSTLTVTLPFLPTITLGGRTIAEMFRDFSFSEKKGVKSVSISI